MRVVLAPDSFKESMTAGEAVEAMARGVLAAAADAECVGVPLADGGEGTTDVLAAALGGEPVTVPCHDALGRPVTGTFAYVPEQALALVEVSTAAGIHQLLPSERDPRVATSFGVGELLQGALDHGARRLVVGLGGTVTNDGGAGMLQALGARLRDATGTELPPGGAALASAATIDLTGLDPRWRQVEVQIAADVTNPLVGPEGASVVFGPQKGADIQAVAELDHALGVWGRLVEATTGIVVLDRTGAGAAGGLGAALLGFFRAEMGSGIDIVMEMTGLEEKVAGADLVLTGEGAIDRQTAWGKTPAGVARLARRHGVPVLAFAGHVGEGAGEEMLFDAVVPIVRGVSDLATALRDGPRNLEHAVATALRLVRLGSTLPRPARAVGPTLRTAPTEAGASGPDFGHAR